jgi:long-chain fatty acid transport protein
MRSLYLAIAAVILLPAAGFAAGYALPNTNARDEGMAGSAVANQTGPEAAFANGAALAGHEGLSMSLSGSLIDFASTWHDPSGSVGANSSASTIPKAAFPVNFNIAYGFKLGDMPVAAGFAFAVPYGGLIYWPTTWPGNANVIHVDRRIYDLELVAAVQPIPQIKFSLGGGVFFGTEKLEQGLDFGTNDGDVQLGTAGHGLTWTIATEITPIKEIPFRIGIQYKHQSVIDFTGNAHFENVPTSFQTQGLFDTTVDHKLTVPNTLNAGLSYDVMPGLTVNAALTFWRFIVYRDDVFTGGNGLVVKVPRDYKNSVTYRLGAEYKLPFFDALTVRTGLVRDVSPQPTYTLDPSLPESSRWAWSVGASYQIIPQLSVTLANEYAWFDETTSTGTNSFPGTYDTHAEIFCLGLTYKMK